ncbi:MAG: homocysteine S-methyltransferase [Caldilineaceae bacterium]
MTDATRPTNPLQPLLARQPFIVLDGALATELERRGAHIADPLWSAKTLLEAPALIRQVHDDYFAAGADVAITASYQASFEGFADRGLDSRQAAAIMRLSIQLAHDARQAFWAQNGDPSRGFPLVAVSVGPYGAFLHNGSEYGGDYGLSIPELLEWHRPRLAVYAQAIRDGLADLLACETIPCLAEAEALVQVLAEFPDIPAWLAFSCANGEQNCRGEHFSQCVALAHNSPQVVAVGVNCTPPQYVASLLQIGAAHTDKPLVAYPNSGESWHAPSRSWLPHTAQDFCALAATWRAAGARFIGGCCRTTPADIAQIRQMLPKETRYAPSLV